MPVVYYGEEKGIDVPDEYNKSTVAMETGQQGGISSEKDPNDTSGEGKKFAFRAPAKAAQMQDQVAGFSENWIICAIFSL